MFLFGRRNFCSSISPAIGRCKGVDDRVDPVNTGSLRERASFAEGGCVPRFVEIPHTDAKVIYLHSVIGTLDAQDWALCEYLIK